MFEGRVDKVEIRKKKPTFYSTRGCPIRHFSRMDLEHEVSEVEDEITLVHVPQRCIDFEQIQEVSELVHYFQNILQL